MKNGYGKTILITGCLGFVGSWVANTLHSKGYIVIGIDDKSGGFESNLNKDILWVECSVTDKDLLSIIFTEHGPDYVYHLAAYAAEGLSHFIRRFNYENNLIGSVNVINECIKHKVKCLVFTSSIAVYGMQKPPFSELIAPEPADPYAISKWAVEMDLKVAYETHGLNSVIFRPFNVYGPNQNFGDPYRNVIGIGIKCALEGNAFPVFGDGLQTRAFSYISSVIPALTKCIEMPETYNQTFNIGGRNPHTILEVVDAVSEASGKKMNINFLPKRHEAKHAFCDTTKADKYFGRPENEVMLKDGVKRMFNWAMFAGMRKSKAFQDIEITENLPPSWKSLT